MEELFVTANCTHPLQFFKCHLGVFELVGLTHSLLIYWSFFLQKYRAQQPQMVHANHEQWMDWWVDRGNTFPLASSSPGLAQFLLLQPSY
jgi:hypothetical protein